MKYVLIGLTLVLLVGCTTLKSGNFKCKSVYMGDCEKFYEQYKAEQKEQIKAENYCLLVVHKVNESLDGAYYTIFDYYGDREQCPSDVTYVADTSMYHGEIFIDLTKPEVNK